VKNEFLDGAVLVAPLLGGFICHGVCIHYQLFKGLVRPVDRGTLFRGHRVLGDNKTYRGLLCVTLGSGIGQLLVGWPLSASYQPNEGLLHWAGAALLGAVVGAAAMIAEFPNSFLKRQLSMAPGAQATGVRGVAFHLLDQVDVLAGAWLALATVVPVSWQRLLGSGLFMYLAHQAVTLLGYLLGMRATAR
jgi:hypothetical protein